MSLSESIDPIETARTPRNLATRAPGHAAMTHLLRELDRRATQGSVPDDLVSWQVGAIGEVLVGHELARLPEGWRVLHAVPAGPKADIDHLVIGPSGVYVINTKRHPDKRVVVGTHVVFINGFAVPYQRDLVGRVGKVQELLRHVLGGATAVQPLLVFVDALSVRQSGEQTVPAVALADVVEYLVGRPTILAPALVQGLFAKFEQPTCWGADRAVLDEPDPSARFHLLPPPARPILPPQPVRKTRASSPPMGRTAARVRPPVARTNASRVAGRLLFGLGLAIGAPVVGLTALSWLATIITALTSR